MNRSNITNNTNFNEIISPQNFVNLRMQGMTFEAIGKQVGLAKHNIYYLYKTYKSCNFDGYCPIDKAALIEQLQSDMDFYEISYKHGISPKGLSFFMADFDIPSRLTVERVRQQIQLGKSKEQIAKFCNVSAPTLYSFISKNNLSAPQ